jgi:nucleoside-diphosphate-sugar epimerase
MDGRKGFSMRVLVTGATGFTARYVIPLLRDRGYDVHGLSSNDCDIRDSSALRDAVAERKPNYVVHLAGTPNLPDSEAEKVFSVNVDGTVNLLKACEGLAERPRKIILVSSSFVYGDTGVAPASEDAPLESSGAYGKSKREMERAAAHWFGRIPILVVRPFNYTGIGHGAQFLVPKLVRLFHERGADASFVDANVVRDYSDVRWVAGVYAHLLERPECGMAVNICSGVATSLPSLVGLLEEVTGHRVAKRPQPGKSMRKTALVGQPKRLFGMLARPSPYSVRDTLSWMVRANNSAARRLDLSINSA